jgi:arsenate reductase-like glutaredoxin family protein
MKLKDYGLEQAMSELKGEDKALDEASKKLLQNRGIEFTAAVPYTHRNPYIERNRRRTTGWKREGIHARGGCNNYPIHCDYSEYILLQGTPLFYPLQ